ncbi:hypothetical protein [Pseudorhodoplanes sp.]|uniref:hypothetical protein n=1 Tax=Pseudorhodoplanes sp. TaxID=1934341 RepID=UPI003D12A0B6
MKFGVVLLLASTAAAMAQSGCPVCETSVKLRDALRKIEIGDPAQRPQGEALGRESIALVTAFRDNPPPPRQGRRAFEALITLGAYAAPFLTSSEYERALAAITTRDPEYRKRYQAMVRKGMRGRDRRATCQVRYLQTNVSVAECKLQEAAKGTSEETAGRLCDTSYSLEQCLAKKK